MLTLIFMAHALYHLKVDHFFMHMQTGKDNKHEKHLRKTADSTKAAATTITGLNP